MISCVQLARPRVISLWIHSSLHGSSKEALVGISACFAKKSHPKSYEAHLYQNIGDVGAGQGYSTLSSNIIRFSELHELPIPIDLGRLDEGNG